MKKIATRNHPERGVERVERDGDTVVVEPDEIPVSQKERLEYYNEGAAGEDEAIVHKRKHIETEYDDGGNPMWVNENHRTSHPRPHQYSIERRLQEQRDPGSTYDVTSDATVEQATARAFTMVAPHVMAGNSLDKNAIVHISNTTGVPIKNVISLENIAKKNIDLTEKYAGIPGTVVDDDPRLEKESEPEKSECKCPEGKCTCPKGECKCEEGKCTCGDGDKLHEEELNQVGVESGLCD